MFSKQSVRSRQRPTTQRGRNNMPRQPPRRDQLRQTRAGSQKTHEERLLKMIVSVLQPLEITEDANFQDFIKNLNNTFQIPTKPGMHSLLLRIYQEKEEELRCTLATADDIVLTCELWSSRPEDSHLTVGCHFVNNLGYLKSHMLKTINLFGDESAANVRTQLLSVMEAWGVKEKVHSVVRAGMPKLENIKWTDMPCFADTLNVIFKNLMKDDELSNVLRKCQNIIRFFKYNFEAERSFRETQRKLGKNQEELIMYYGEQWLPWLHMLQGLHSQYETMVMVLNKNGKTGLILNEKDKEKIKNLISALNPLEKAMSMMKREGFETISVMLPLLKALMDKLREEEGRNNDIAKTLLHKCKREFGNIDNHQLATNTFLDPRHKNKLGEQNKKKAISKITQELLRNFTPAKIKGILARYEAERNTSESANPFAWWRYTGNARFGELRKLALKKLGVVSTAVPLERAFSIAGDRFCNLRSSIEPENLNMILFLNSNWSSEC
nr:uncharacterized protein LOC109965256 [Monopterus albus]